MTTKTSADANINALKGCLVIIGDSFHLYSGDPSGKTMRCPFQHDKSSVFLRPSCWLNYTLFSMQHLLIGLIDFPPLLQLLITMLDSGIGYLNHYTVWSTPAAQAAERLHEPGQIKAQQFVRINAFTFFDTIAAYKWRRLALGNVCCWVIRMALTGAAEGGFKAQRPDSRGSGTGSVELKLGFD